MTSLSCGGRGHLLLLFLLFKCSRADVCVCSIKRRSQTEPARLFLITSDSSQHSQVHTIQLFYTKSGLLLSRQLKNIIQLVRHVFLPHFRVI